MRLQRCWRIRCRLRSLTRLTPRTSHVLSRSANPVAGGFSSSRTRNETTPSESSAPDERRGARGHSMSKAKRRDDDDLLPEYDFASMTGGVRGKYVARLRRGSNLVLLDPDVAAAFPSDGAVNEALRGVLNTARAVRGKGGLPNKALQPTSRAASSGRKPGRAGAARG